MNSRQSVIAVITASWIWFGIAVVVTSHYDINPLTLLLLSFPGLTIALVWLFGFVVAEPEAFRSFPRKIGWLSVPIALALGAVVLFIGWSTWLTSDRSSFSQDGQPVHGPDCVKRC
jgi:hypothetical protein